MKIERIEALLRSQPPDEPTDREGLALPPRLIRATSGHVQERRPFTRGARVLSVLVGFVALAVAMRLVIAGPTVGPSPTTSPNPSPTSALPRGVIPWIDATPTPSPTPEATPQPASLPACTAADLVLIANGWGGATGSLAGGASVINLSSNPCTVGGRPAIELRDSRGAAIVHSGPAEAPSPADLVVLQPGGVAGVITVWMNWCGAPPARPLKLQLALPRAAGELAVTISETGPSGQNEVPRCDSPDQVSTFGVPLPFAPPDPSQGGYAPHDCRADELSAYLSNWGAAAGTSYANLVVVNADSFDCLLGSSPALELRDATGRRIIVAQSEPLPVSKSTILLPPGWAAFVRLGYSDWCTPAPELPLRANLVIGAAELRVRTTSDIPVPPCMAAPATPPPTLFYDGTLAIPGAPLAPEPDPTDSLPIDVKLTALPSTRPGGTLDYTVTLTNVSAYNKPLNLAALCPTYTERLLLPNRQAIETRLSLNCDPVGVLEANAPVTLAMRLSIPADAPTGVATLVWQLGERGPAAKSTFVVGP
jgi:hypothetical protein